jgi:hypothetical protein
VFVKKIFRKNRKKNIYLPVSMLCVQSETGNPMTPRIFIILLLLACILCTAGCMMPSDADNISTETHDTSIPPAMAKYKQTLAQPEESAKMIKMDTDLYNIGEVVEFTVTNEKTSDLSCTNDPPSFAVRYQKGSGQWITRMGDENPPPGNATNLKPGESTVPGRFITTGWVPGRYRIVSDCGVSREILLRTLLPVTPAVTSCHPAGNTLPYIRVNAISDQYAGKTFTIAGTTSLPAGEDLQYSLFAILPSTGNVTSQKLLSNTLRVSGGDCGVNTWSVNGQIRVPGDYFIGITDSANTVSAVKRFTVLADDLPTATATSAERTKAPGITTG